MLPTVVDLKRRRLKLRVTIELLANLTNIKPSRLAAIESGEIDPPYSEIRRIEEALEKAAPERMPREGRYLSRLRLDDILVHDKLELSYLMTSWHIGEHAGIRKNDYFCKFFREYLAFLTQMGSRFKGVSKERELVQRFKSETGIEAEHLKKKYMDAISNDKKLEEAWEKVISELNRQQLKNDTGGKGWWNISEVNPGRDIPVKRTEGIVHGIEDWINMVEFWYIIRNNLFHGKKDPDDSRDRLLVKNAFKTLNPLVKILMDSNNTSSAGR